MGVQEAQEGDLNITYSGKGSHHWSIVDSTTLHTECHHPRSMFQAPITINRRYFIVQSWIFGARSIVSITVLSHACFPTCTSPHEILIPILLQRSNLLMNCLPRVSSVTGLSCSNIEVGSTLSIVTKSLYAHTRALMEIPIHVAPLGFSVSRLPRQLRRSIEPARTVLQLLVRACFHIQMALKL